MPALPTDPVIEPAATTSRFTDWLRTAGQALQDERVLAWLYSAL
jgi:hypothetical protein